MWNRVTALKFRCPHGVRLGLIEPSGHVCSGRTRHVLGVRPALPAPPPHYLLNGLARFLSLLPCFCLLPRPAGSLRGWQARPPLLIARHTEHDETSALNGVLRSTIAVDVFLPVSTRPFFFRTASASPHAFPLNAWIDPSFCSCHRCSHCLDISPGAVARSMARHGPFAALPAARPVRTPRRVLGHLYCLCCASCCLPIARCCVPQIVETCIEWPSFEPKRLGRAGGRGAACSRRSPLSSLTSSTRASPGLCPPLSRGGSARAAPLHDCDTTVTNMGLRHVRVMARNV